MDPYYWTKFVEIELEGPGRFEFVARVTPPNSWKVGFLHAATHTQRRGGFVIPCWHLEFRELRREKPSFALRRPLDLI